MPIAYMPQNIALINADFYQNIALSEPLKKIDKERVKWAASIASIDQFINNCNDKFYTNPIKEGILLSGGQIQRIGIARAIYKYSKILILDEATSALDKKTEGEVLSRIFSLKQYEFIFAISHKSSILQYSNKVLKL